MKLKHLSLLLVLILASCQNSQKIGYVDNGKVINAYQEKIDLDNKFETINEIFTKKTDSLIQAFQMEYNTYEVRSHSMTKAKKEKEFGVISKKQQALQQSIEMEQQMLQRNYQTEMDSVINKVKVFVNDFGKKENYEMILGTSDVSATVMYGNDKLDITEKVISELNATFNKKQ
ncbi:MAG: hypothetical protein BM564_02320 [Bacteroidetes bacterium MedPE-SWsnd-G2]|nr:MAG: hypothetical protein BM564_02320 [Bacteroidetes bacterium MedPE-SWsnd-G2]